jgi:hypothetical protein
MLAPLGAKVVDVFPAVFPAVAFNVLVSLAPMLAPPGATVVVVVLFVVVAAPASRAGLPVVVAFCGKQADCVTFVPPNVSNSKRVGKAIVVMNLPYILDLIAVFLSGLLLLVSLS